MEPEDLSSEQREVIKKFREQVKDVLQQEHGDYFLSRWLIARSWNISKAEKMFRKSLEWRKLNDIDNILTTWEAPEVLRKYLPGGFCGFDKEGSPLWIENIGNIDLKGLFCSARKKDLIRNRMYVLELSEDMLEKQRQKRGKHPGGITMIYDFENFGLKHLWKPGVDLVGELFYMSETNYPELLKTCFVINAPSLFYVVYNILKVFLHEKTRKKVHVLGSNWKEKVLEVIDAEELPVHWGGTQRDPDGDEYCRSKLCLGGEVPKAYYSSQHVTLDRTSLTQATIQKASSLQVDLHIDNCPAVIRWQFLTEENDVGFGIFRRHSAERQKAADMEDVVVSERVNSHQVPEEGCVIVKEPGTYVVRFDNTYSWVNGKKLYYKVDVLPMDDDSTAGAGI